jgi:hypothetical protein
LLSSNGAATSRSTSKAQARETKIDRLAPYETLPSITDPERERVGKYRMSEGQGEGPEWLSRSRGWITRDPVWLPVSGLCM